MGGIRSSAGKYVYIYIYKFVAIYVANGHTGVPSVQINVSFVQNSSFAKLTIFHRQHDPFPPT